MKPILGIRREDKNQWERRVPLTPEHVSMLVHHHGIEVIVQPSMLRAFPDDAYRNAGARIDDDLSSCSMILGVKEMPMALFFPNKAYLFFSHTIKGQSYNMPMLQKMMERKCHLIDYERIIDKDGRRLVLFGRYAGLAGMIETLHALGMRLKAEGFTEAENPFVAIQQPYCYGSVETAEKALSEVGRRIELDGLPPRLVPLVVGFLGYGNVSKGAQEILYRCFPLKTVSPSELSGLFEGETSSKHLYVLEFHEQDTVIARDGSNSFDLQHYWQHPEYYRANFARYLPYLTVVINGIYWDQRYPVLISADDLRDLFGSPNPRLRVIGDITCDIEGSIAVTRKGTSPDQPCYLYDTREDTIKDGFQAGSGPLIMAVDNLPCEFPIESSRDFGDALMPLLPKLCRTDFSRPTEDLDIPGPVQSALILHHGALTPPYRYLQDYLPKNE